MNEDMAAELVKAALKYRKETSGQTWQTIADELEIDQATLCEGVEAGTVAVCDAPAGTEAMGTEATGTEAMGTEAMGTEAGAETTEAG